MLNFLVMVAVGILASHAPSWGEEITWELLESDPHHSDFFYNKSTISRSPEGVISVWAKVAYTKEGKADTLQILTAKAYQKYPFLIDNDTPKKLVSDSCLTAPRTGSFNLKLSKPLVIYSRYELNNMLLKRAEKAASAPPAQDAQPAAKA